MAEKRGSRGKLRRVPLLGGILDFIGTFREVYDEIGWTDPAYHSVRSNEERLDEARRVARLGGDPSEPPSEPK